MTTYNTFCKKIINLTEHVKRLIVQLYLNYHYDGSNEHKVLADLEDKSEIVLMYYHEELLGFTTL